MLAHAGEAGVSKLVRGRALHSVYQPIVDLHTRDIVGYEALIRGPAGSELESPDALFAAARAQACVAELDRECRALAVDGALSAGLGPPLALFVNVEPAWLDGRPLLDAAHEALVGAGSLRLIFEFTERELTFRPADVLALVERYRRLGCGIALDDVGKDARSLALLAFVSPDLIKLDMRLVQERTAGSTARTIHAVRAHTERSGAKVLAEGVETEAHRRNAIALGARYGQGWLFGHPGPLDRRQRSNHGPRPESSRQAADTTVGDGASWLGPWRRSSPRVAGSSSFQTISAKRVTRHADKRLLCELSQQLEVQARELGPEAVLLATFQHRRFFTPRTARHYQDLAERLALVAAIGVDMPPEPAPGVRGAHLEPNDPLRGEWTIVVISAHFAAAFAATELPEPTGVSGPFEYAMTFDRDLAIAAASILMQRVIPSPPPAATAWSTE
jgi:EAL domain-containing protein (putative c-di-GMP-specific phosphodiesterase class I)